jgi:thioredoxin-related protein
MKKVIFISLFFCVLLFCGSFKIATTTEVVVPEKIHWYTFQQAFDLNKTKPKKVFIDVYTEWCGWCKKMEATTFQDPHIIKLMNQYFYAVKLDAEMKDTVRMDTVRFVNPNPKNPRSAHQLAMALLSNQMSYPTSVVLNEKFALLSQPIQGYMPAENLEPILVFLGEDISSKETWEEFSKNYKR